MRPPEALLGIARRALADGVRGRRYRPDPSAFDAALGTPGASFVTLTAGPALRGCRGTLEPRRALLDDVARNSWLTAFEDPRFPPVRSSELADLTIELSLLSPLAPLAVSDLPGLVAAIAPDRPGLVLARGPRRATFLPKVWASLPEPETFVRALLNKAGLPPDRWSTDHRAWTYSVTSCRGPARG